MAMFKAIDLGDANKLMRLLNTDPSLLERVDMSGGVWGDRRTPLIHAAYIGELESVKLLTAKGADMNATTSHGHTALHGAAARGHEKVVVHVLANGAQASHQTHRGNTPLMLAVENGHTRVALRLLEHMGRQGLEAICEIEGRTALHLAVYWGSTELVARLLDHGARADTKDRHGTSALQAAVGHGHWEIIKLLVGHLGPEALHEGDCRGESLLHMALERRPEEELVTYLLSKGPWPTVRDGRGQTALMCAAMWASMKVLQRLLEHTAGQGLNDRSRYGETALHYAVLHDLPENVRALLLAGADPTIVDHLQRTPRMLTKQGTIHRKSAEVFKWWDGGVACALVLHRARALHNAYTTQQEAPTRPVPGYLKARAEAGLALPQVEVVAGQQDGAGWEGDRKRTRAATMTHAAGIRHELPSIVELVVGELSEELFTELLQGFSDWRSEG